MNIRPADHKDRAAISAFLNSGVYFQSHLDWIPTLDLLGEQPFVILEDHAEIQAVLACPPDPPEIAWVRLFASSYQLRPFFAWNALMPIAQEKLTHQGIQIAVLCLQEWMDSILAGGNFRQIHSVVLLEHTCMIGKDIPLPPGFELHPMAETDIFSANVVDRAAFEPPWYASARSTEYGFHACVYKTVIVTKGQVVAYLYSTLADRHAHLARLAVLPDFQRNHLGYYLVKDMLSHFLGLGIVHISVNTQSINLRSLALYDQLGFEVVDKGFPVYVYP